MPLVRFSNACSRKWASSPASCATSVWIRKAASGLRNSWAASDVKRRSRNKVAEVRSKNWFKFLINGKISVGKLSVGNNDVSSGGRFATCSPTSFRLRNSRRIINPSAVNKNGKPANQIHICPNTILLISSSRYSCSCPTATIKRPPATGNQKIRQSSSSSRILLSEKPFWGA